MLDVILPLRSVLLCTESQGVLVLPQASLWCRHVYPQQTQCAWESLRECRESSMHSKNSFWPSKGTSSITVCTSYGKPRRWSHDACLMTTAVAMDQAVVSAERLARLYRLGGVLQILRTGIALSWPPAGHDRVPPI